MVTCVGGAGVAVLLDRLRNDSYFNYHIIGVDCIGPGFSSERVDSFHVVPEGNDPGYVDAICSIIERESVQVILPGSDEEALSLARCREQLETLGTSPLVSSEECLTLISDKEQTYKRLVDSGISVPEYTAVETSDQLADAISGYSYPERTVVVKPSRSRGNRGLYVLLGQDNPPDWLGGGARECRLRSQEITDEMYGKFISQYGSALVMPCLYAPAFDADLVASETGPIVVVRERINPPGIPFMGNRILADPKLKQYCIEISDALNLDAIHDVDLMTDGYGQIQLLEVNPRTSGSLAASLVAGFRLVDVAIGYALGYPITQSEPDHEILVMPNEVGMYAVG
jgi:carbamoyl-phosphate synthase large subunit